MQKRFLIAFVLIGVLFMLPVHAQEIRDYAISNISHAFTEDGSQVIIDLVITNEGADASTTAEIVVRVLTDDSQIYWSDTLNPLNSGESIAIRVPFDTQNFPPGSRQSIEASVGIDAFELANTPIAENNVVSIVIPIPEKRVVLDTSTPLAFDGDDVIVLGYPLSRQRLVLFVVVLVGLVVVFWIFTVIVRLIFGRPPRFPTWQPPYGWMPNYDQQSLEGRRQAWQHHAQNGLLLTAPTEGNLHAVKLLMSIDGEMLANWDVSALRLSQYDTYGRIARSQSIASNKLIKRLNNTFRKRLTMQPDQLQKSLKPIASGLVKQFRKQIGHKNIFLPIAFDMRLEGRHGEVRILFELYQCRQQVWYRLDQWEPSMMVVSQMVQENLTFTIHGKMNDEKPREFFSRLEDDLIWLLMELIRVEQPVQEQEELPHEMFNIPDTLSGMEPIRDESQPVKPGA